MPLPLSVMDIIEVLIYSTDILVDEGKGQSGGQSELLLSIFTLAVFPSSSFVIQEAL